MLKLGFFKKWVSFQKFWKPTALIEVNENFGVPDFSKRWHMSLGCSKKELQILNGVDIAHLLEKLLTENSLCQKILFYDIAHFAL